MRMYLSKDGNHGKSDDLLFFNILDITNELYEMMLNEPEKAWIEIRQHLKETKANG